MELPLLLTALFGIVVLACTTFAALSWYRSPAVPIWITILVYLAWFLGFASLLLLPLDVATLYSTTEGSRPAELLQCWEVVYWITWIMAWVLLPTVQEFWAAGDFTWQDRFYTAITKNLRVITLIGVSAALFIVYCLMTGRDLSIIGGFLMACGNTYGLILVCLLLGYGLVEVCHLSQKITFICY